MRFVAEFKDKLISCYKQNWHSEIESDEIYKWYYSFKNSFVAENYLSFITTNRFRDTLTRFRLRACGLRSHKIWFLTEASKTVAARCVGIYWKMRYMFLFQCPAYEQIRQKYGLTEPINLPNWSHVRNMLACEDELKTINLSKFLTIALDIWGKKKQQQTEQE